MRDNSSPMPHFRTGSSHSPLGLTHLAFDFREKYLSVLLPTQSMDTLWRGFESSLLNEGVTDARIAKLQTMFRICCRELGKPFEQVSRADVEAFVDGLHRNRIRRGDGAPYSGSTKSDVKKFLRQFFKWYRGDNESYPREVSWVRTRIRKDEKPQEKPVVSREEVEQVAAWFLKPEHRMLTLLLFDSGFRIQEMLSVKKGQLTWEPFDDRGNQCWWIECTQSKTERRKVDVPLFTKQLERFVRSHHYRCRRDDDPLFGLAYDAYRTALGRASRAVVGKRLTPHALRHSSATFYARMYRGDLIQLAERYGWSYAAKELRTYVRRSGTTQRRAAQQVFSNEVNELRTENASLRERLDVIEGVLQRLQDAAAMEVQQRISPGRPSRGESPGRIVSSGDAPDGRRTGPG